GQKGHDNGAILLVAPNERKVRIEVGYGLEDRLTEAGTRLIIENAIRRAFQRGDFEPGLWAGEVALVQIITAEEPQQPVRHQRTRHQSSGFPFILIILFFVLMGGRGLFWPLLFMNMGRRGGGFGGGFSGGSGGGFSGGGGGFSGGGGSFGGG